MFEALVIAPVVSNRHRDVRLPGETRQQHLPTGQQNGRHGRAVGTSHVLQSRRTVGRQREGKGFGLEGAVADGVTLERNAQMQTALECGLLPKQLFALMRFRLQNVVEPFSHVGILQRGVVVAICIHDVLRRPACSQYLIQIGDLTNQNIEPPVVGIQRWHGEKE